MQAVAHLNEVRLSPQKTRLVARLLKRGMHVSQALIVLSEMPQKSAGYIKKCLNSAIANYENNLHGDVDDLFIESICVDQGPTFKRVSPRAKGRADHIKKPTSHISVVVADRSVQLKKRD